MDGLVAKFMKRDRSVPESGADMLATLIVAASEDADFRKRLISVLRLPASQREPLIKTAVDEMRLRGEPANIRSAFLTLATQHGAQTALHLLEGDVK
jgi:hypothetical protein